MPINVFEPKSQFLSSKTEINKAIKKVLDSGIYIVGNEVKNLERNFSKLHKAKYAVAVKNGTDAISISLKVLGVKKGDEVITTSHTALATLAAIINTGAKPVIADIEKNYYTLDPLSIKKKITKKTKAIIPVHIYGQCCDMEKILKLAKDFNLKVLEDCAQAHGAKIGSKFVGTFGDISTFSFYPTKNLGAIGDGGIILSNNKPLIDKIKRYREYGWDKYRRSKLPGINSRLDEIQAAIINVKIKKFENSKSKRINIAREYLKNIRNKKLILPKIRNNTTHVFHIFSVLTKQRKKLINYLNKHNIRPGIHYLRLAHENIGYKKYCKYNNKDLKNSKTISGSTISLPIYPELKLINVKKIIKILNNF